MASASMPLRAISQATTELEFHMSPVRKASRPQTAIGTRGARSSNRRAQARSRDSRRGLSTASSTSGMRPSSHRRIP